MSARSIIAAIASACALLAVSTPGAQAQTLAKVKERGALLCGVSQGLLGFSSADEKGQWSGFDVDFCRAVAAAVFDDPNKVRFVPLSAADRFAALKKGDIDLLSRNSTWTMGRETELGLSFAGITYHDGQGFLVPKASNAISALELDKAKVCVQAGTTSADNVRDYFAANGMALETVAVSSPAEALQAYQAGRCTVVSSDVSQLHAERMKLPKSGDHLILPDVISKEPLGPVVRNDDVQWLTIVKWVNFAMVNAEELGVSRQTIDDALKSQKADVRRLVGADGQFGSQLGLSNAWAANVVRHVGNYGDVYDRNVGSASKLGIPRGLNQLWALGGILYAPPIR